MTKKIFGAATIAGLLLMGSSVYAEGDVVVSNTNVASVHNTAVVSSNTGWNSAYASALALGGNGGDANTSGFGGGLAVGGDGGEGLATAFGGEIITGDALASSLIVNDVNSTDVTVDAESCGCVAITEKHSTGSDSWYEDQWWNFHKGDHFHKEGGSSEGSHSEWDNSFYKETPVPQGDIAVLNTNVADVESTAVVASDTGNNYVGAEALATGGYGGDAKVKGKHFPFFSYWDEEEYEYPYFLGGEAIAGDGGMGTAEAMGGVIMTGNAASLSEIGSVVNDTVVRVEKN